MLTELHIGIDDTDSEKGGCTTYTATVLFQDLIERGFKPSDFPWLVRLNPNIPWKTRGNGALAVHFFVEEEQIENVQRLAIETVERTTVASARGTDPVTFAPLAIIGSTEIPGEAQGLNKIPIQDAEKTGAVKRTPSGGIKFNGPVLWLSPSRASSILN